MTYEEYKQKVVRQVKERLQTKKWFRGVCLDNLESDFLEGKSIEDAVDSAASITAYWDADLFPDG